MLERNLTIVGDVYVDSTAIHMMLESFYGLRMEGALRNLERFDLI